MPGCSVKTRKLKRHAFNDHLPVVFRDVVFPRAEIDENFQQIRGNALQTLAQWILGCGTATVFDLVRHVNENNLVPEKANILERQVIQYQLFSYSMRWRQPLAFNLHPVNSPAVLIHWRVLLVLISLISREERLQWRLTGQGYTAPPISDESDDEEEQPMSNPDPVSETVPVSRNFPGAFDSHFHLDRLAQILDNRGILKATANPTATTVDKFTWWFNGIL